MGVVADRFHELAEDDALDAVRHDALVELANLIGRNGDVLVGIHGDVNVGRRGKGMHGPEHHGAVGLAQGHMVAFIQSVGRAGHGAEPEFVILGRHRGVGNAGDGRDRGGNVLEQPVGGAGHDLGCCVCGKREPQVRPGAIPEE